MTAFHDLKPLHAHLATELQEATARVMQSGWFVLGPELKAFEQQLARYLGVEHAVGVANGTDAIELALRAAGIGRGDEVVTVSHTAVATVCAIERAGARPVLVDIDPVTYTICPRAAAAAVTSRTRAVLAVHLYGHPAELDALSALCHERGLLLIEDCAQAIGARYRNRRVGSIGHLSTFSFYPTKNLGACGDAGAVATNDPAWAERIARLRFYGQTSRERVDQRGINSRLDELQAAILAVKLRHLDAFNQRRRELAAHYSAQLEGVACPVERDDVEHVYHLYVVRHAARDHLQRQLAGRDIGTLVHYPTPVHLQPAYADLGYQPGSLPESERAAREVLSLPMYFGLSEAEVDTICQAVREAPLEIEA